MIDKLIYFSRADIEKYVWQKLEKPLAAEVMHYAAINIHDPERAPSAYQAWVQPVLDISFHNIKSYEIKSKRLILFGEKHAQRVIHFINQLDESSTHFTLLINSENGRNRSASIARFLQSVNPNLSIAGLNTVTTDWHNPYVTRELNRTYSIMYRAILKMRSVNEKPNINSTDITKLTTPNSNSTYEPKSNSEQTLRGKEDNTRI